MLTLDMTTLPPVKSSVLRPSVGVGYDAEVEYVLASDDPADLETWAAAIGGHVTQVSERVLYKGCRLVSAEAVAPTCGLRVTVRQTRIERAAKTLEAVAS